MTERKIAIYKRYSTDKQDMKTQDKEIADFIEKENIQNYEFYSDEAKSGYTTARPEFQRLSKDIEAGKINKVIGLKLDRIGRNTRDLQNFLYLLQKNNVDMVLIKDKINTEGAMGKLFYDILCAFAEFERNSITERMRSGLLRAKAEGKICHRQKKDINIYKIVKWRDEHKLSFTSIRKLMENEGDKVSLATIIRRYRETKK